MVVLAVVAMSVVAALAWFMLPDRIAAQDAPFTVAKPALTVTATAPRAMVLPIRLSAYGKIAAWQEASISTEANGLRLTSVTVNVGDIVRRGQVLAIFASDSVEIDLDRSRAAVAEAKASLAEAKDTAERAQKLQSTGALSAHQIQQYTTAESTARARLAVRQADERAQHFRMSQTKVLAPDDGVISARTATVGAVFPAGQEMFRLIRRGRLEWRGEVAASDLAKLKPGQKVLVTPVGGEPGEGNLRVLSPTVNTQTGNGQVYVDLPPGGRARDGMFAYGEFVLGESRAMTLPQSAVLLRDGHSYVMRIGGDSRVAQTAIKVGRRVGGYIEVVEGLESSARVVASGVGFLGDGDLVRVVVSPEASINDEPASNPNSAAIN